MIYKTRHLQALSDVAIGSEYFTKGESFRATPTDADYLISRKKAKELPAGMPETAPVAQTSVPAPVIQQPELVETHLGSAPEPIEVYTPPEGADTPPNLDISEQPVVLTGDQPPHSEVTSTDTAAGIAETPTPQPSPRSPRMGSSSSSQFRRGGSSR